jgi:drug/metabolite transporter (DMT)-like permease
MPDVLRQRRKLAISEARTYRAATALMVGAALAYGAAVPAAKAALDHLSVLQILFWTRTLVVVALAPRVLLERRTAPRANGLGRFGLALGVLLFASYGLLLLGLTGTGAATATVVLSLHIVVTPAVARVMIGEAPAPGLVGAAAICTFGATLTARGAGTPTWSAAVIAGAALLTAVHTTTLGVAARRFEASDVVFAQNAVTGAIALIAVRGRIAPGDALDAAAPLLAGAILPALVAASAQVRAQQVISTGLSAVILSLEPLCAALLSIVLLGEPLTTSLVLGGALLAIGIAYALRAERRAGVAGSGPPPS